MEENYKTHLKNREQQISSITTVNIKNKLTK